MNKARRLQANQRDVRMALLCVMLAAVFLASGCGKQLVRMEDNQAKLQAMVKANSRQIAALSSQVHVTEDQLSDKIAEVDRGTQSVAAQVTEVRDEQVRTSETVAAGHQYIRQRIAVLEGNQAVLTDGLAHIAGITQTTASEVTAVAKAHTTLHRMVQDHSVQLTDGLTAVSQGQQGIQTGIGLLQQSDQRLARNMEAVANRQETLHETLQESDSAALARFASLTAGQNRIGSEIDDLHALTQRVDSDLNRVAGEQAAIQNSLKSGNMTLAEKIALVQSNQHDLQTLINQVASLADQTADNVTALGAGQSAMQKARQTEHAAMSGQLEVMAQEQQNIQAGVAHLKNTAASTAHDLAELGGGQRTIQQRIDTTNDTVVAKLNGMAYQQHGLQSHLQDLNAKAEQIGSEVDAVATTQRAMQGRIQSDNGILKDHVTTVAAGQQTLHSTVAELGEKTDQAAASLAEVVQNHDRAVTSSLAALTAGQGTLETRLDTVAQAATQTQAKVGGLADHQKALRQSLVSHDLSVTQQMMDVADTQRLMQSRLTGAAATTDQLATDVAMMGDRQAQLEQSMQDTFAKLGQDTESIHTELTEVADGQSTLRRSLASHDLSIAQQMVDMADTQKLIQSTLSGTAATTTRVATDVAQVGNRQLQLEQAVRTGRDDLTVKLAQITRQQQQWQTEVGETKASAETLTAAIAALEQHVTELQGTLQERLERISARLDAGGAQGNQFEASVSQDIQGIAASVSQIREVQADLISQIERVQNNVENQGQDILSVLDRLQREAERANVSGPAVDFEASMAQPPQEILLP